MMCSPLRPTAYRGARMLLSDAVQCDPVNVWGRGEIHCAHLGDAPGGPASSARMTAAALKRSSAALAACSSAAWKDSP